MTTAAAVSVVALTTAAARARLLRAVAVVAQGSEHATSSKKYSRYLRAEARETRAHVRVSVCLSVLATVGWPWLPQHWATVT